MIEFKIGLVFWDSPNRFKPKKYHVVNIFEDSGEKVVTYKYWSVKRMGWVFTTEYVWSLEISFKYENHILKK